ncbi:MAG: GspH/FimT family protein [Defluviitaleaceae bacterium]|nr:GspH/FimT family protein [Defluviitaleaceae bacterium]
MKKNGGLTLLELTVTMAVLMVVVGVVLIGTRGDNNDYRALHNAALVLQSDLRYAQRRAVTEGRRIGIQFDPVNNRYSIITIEPEFQTFRIVSFADGIELIHTTHQGERVMYQPRGTGNPGTVILRNGQHSQRITTTLSGGQVRTYEIISE